jgi:hypothetical protein
VKPDTVEKVVVEITDEEKARQERVANRPSLDEILNLHDFEVLLLRYRLFGWPNDFPAEHCQTGTAGKGLGILFVCRGR